MEGMDKETEKQIQELQVLEQNLQSIMMQKQSMQLEISEVENALTEIAKAKDDVYKIAGQIMIKATKEEIEKDLKQKQELISIRLTSIDKQEQVLEKDSEALRKEVLGKIQK